MNNIRPEAETLLSPSRRGLAFGLGGLALAGAVGVTGVRAASPSRAGLDAGAVDQAVKAAYDRYKDLNEGANADYIPALAKVPSTLFGIALMTPGGQVSPEQRPET